MKNKKVFWEGTCIIVYVLRIRVVQKNCLCQNEHINRVWLLVGGMSSGLGLSRLECVPKNKYIKINI